MDRAAGGPCGAYTAGLGGALEGLEQAREGVEQDFSVAEVSGGPEDQARYNRGEPQ
jgi:hypothetical protein